MNLRSIKLSVSTFLLGLVGTASVLMTGCKSDPNSPGFEFMPDMYRSPSYETYLENHAFGGPDSMSARMPVEGTVPRGFTPALVDGTPEGFAASANLKNPISYSKETLAEGKELYRKMCSHCHGEKGDGDGKVVTKGGHPGPQSYASGMSSRGGKMSELAPGQIFHTITYGLNMMGPHASQILPEDRWKIVHYVEELQGKKKGETKDAMVMEAASDSTKTE